MSREADKLSDTLSGVDALEAKAEAVGRKIESAFSELDQALNMADQFGDGALRVAGKIKGFLSRFTNSGPALEDTKVIEHKPE